jgi:hypothetical protein
MWPLRSFQFLLLRDMEKYHFGMQDPIRAQCQRSLRQ